MQQWDIAAFLSAEDQNDDCLSLAASRITKRAAKQVQHESSLR